MAQDPLVQDLMTTISTWRFYALNSPRSQKTQLTRYIFIFEETVSYFNIRKKNTGKVSSMKVQTVCHWVLSYRILGPGVPTSYSLEDFFLVNLSN